MAYLTKIDTSTLASQNINTVLLAHTFTNTTRLRKLVIDVFLTGIVGNGDYVAYVTRQLSGAGVWYEAIKTTKTVDAGIVSIMFNSIELTADLTDAIKVYVLGLAGDNAGVVGTIVNVTEEWLAVDADGRIDLGSILGTALTETIPGYLAAGFKELFDVVTPVFNLLSKNQSADNDSKLTTILNRIGAFTGSGLNTILGFFRAVMRKDAAITPSDVGGTFDNTTDSEEAIRDRGDAAWTTGGGGLTAQQTRDAMYLAPSAGVPQAASIDEKLNLLVPGAAIVLNDDETTIVVNS